MKTKLRVSPGGASPKMSARRMFIAAGSAGTLMVGAWWLRAYARPLLADAVLKHGPSATRPPNKPGLWFEVLASGVVTVYVPKVEMGQGIHTVVAQLAAEELDLEPDDLKVVQADSRHGFSANAMFTYGSSSTHTLYVTVREAAATLREMLRLEAARQFGLASHDVVVKAGRFMALGSNLQTLGFGEVIVAKRGVWKVPKTPALKPHAEFHRVGQNYPRVDARAKLTGTAVYGYSARLDGMLYGAVARPPRYGARLVRALTDRAQQQPGVLKVAVDLKAGFVGLAATTRTQANAALSALELTWEGGTTLSQSELEQALSAPRSGGAVLRRRGDTARVLAAPGVIEASYRTPLAAHAHLEPLAALANVTASEVEVWVSTQSPGQVERDLKAAFPGKTIRVHPTYLGGGFGRKTTQHAALEAARLSRATGTPVHVGWTREDDLQHAFYRPPTHTRFRARLEHGQVLALEQHTVSGDIIFGVQQPPGGDVTINLLGFDPGVLIGQFAEYHIPAYTVINHRLKLPIPTGPWRGLGSLANIFALESFMDELAHQANLNPLEFRLRHLPQDALGKRFERALLTATNESGWTRTSTPGRGLGLACCADVNTVVAVVSEVSVEDGRIRVERVTVAVDPGLVVNPAGARLQAVGSVVMGLSSALLERLTVTNGLITESNFDSYPIIDMMNTPPIDVHLIESGEVPFGMGEPVIGPVAASVGNAIFALTGQRLRSLPFDLQCI